MTAFSQFVDTMRKNRTAGGLAMLMLVAPVAGHAYAAEQTPPAQTQSADSAGAPNTYAASRHLVAVMQAQAEQMAKDTHGFLNDLRGNSKLDEVYASGATDKGKLEQVKFVIDQEYAAFAAKEGKLTSAMSALDDPEAKVALQFVPGLADHVERVEKTRKAVADVIATFRGDVIWGGDEADNRATDARFLEIDIHKAEQALDDHMDALEKSYSHVDVTEHSDDADHVAAGPSRGI